MKNQKHLFVYYLIGVLSLTLIFGGCNRPMTSADGVEYDPPPCARYNHGSIRYENSSKNVIRVSCKQIHADITLNPRSFIEIQRIPAGKTYKATYQDIGKRKGKIRYENFYVTACETNAVSLR